MNISPNRVENPLMSLIPGGVFDLDPYSIDLAISGLCRRAGSRSSNRRTAGSRRDGTRSGSRRRPRPQQTRIHALFVDFRPFLQGILGH